MPQALQAGIPYKEFWHLTPAAIIAVEKAFTENLKYEQDQAEQAAWLTGQYVLAAIGVAFSRKKIKYPENPIVLREKNKTELTEDEKQKRVEALFGQLGHMQKTFEAHNGGDKRKDKKGK